jgi:molybdopterin-guanine dinucleotide biosynthesis protein A
MADTIRLPAAAGIVLAGGESRRLGSDKRSLAMEGEPLLRRVLAALAELCDELVVVESERSPVPPALLAGFEARLVRDAWPDAGPLAGIEAGLRAVAPRTALVVAADHPWLRPPLLELLLAELARAPEAEAAVIASERGLEPLLGAYRSGVVEVARRLLESGERRMGALLDAVPVRAVPPSVWRRVDPDGRSLANVNAAADLE